MLIGSESVIIKKLIGNLEDLEDLERNKIQYNNIYSLDYIESVLGKDWNLKVIDDNISNKRLDNHIKELKRDDDPMYSNRISRNISGMEFKGEIYMPWKYLVGIRN